MDIPRIGQARRRRIRWTVYGILAVGAIGGISWYVYHLKPAAPPVERATVWTSTVKRGSIKREVRGPGTLVPLEIRWVAAVASGRVERKLVQPGEYVKADTVLVELSNPELEKEVLTAEWDWKSAESNLDDFKVQLEVADLNREADLVKLQSDYSTAKMRSEAQDTLAKFGLTTGLDVRQAKETANNLANQIELQKQLREKNKASTAAQLAVRKREIDKLHALYQLKHDQLEQLKVRAGVAGVLQQLDAQEGEQIAAGTKLARVANPAKLKAELKIAETQAKDVQMGQRASIDTRNNLIPGHVIRKDPKVTEGTVTVDVALEGDLPQGAVPDLSVDGTIELERLNDVIYVERPTQGQEGSLIGLFKLTPDGKEAVRVQVKIGRVSVSVVEILSGLQPGDQVILSDMSAYDANDRIRII